VTATAPSTSPIATAPAVVEIGRELEALERQLGAQRAALADKQTELSVAQRSKGTGSADRVHTLGVEVEELEATIVDLERQQVDVRQRDTATREAAARAALERERVAAEAALAATATAMTSAALELVKVCAVHRAALEQRAAVEVAISGRADDARAVIVSRNAGGVIQALEPVMSWVTRDPAIQPLARDHYGTPREPKWTDPISQLVAQFFAAWNEQQDHAGGV